VITGFVDSVSHPIVAATQISGVGGLTSPPDEGDQVGFGGAEKPDLKVAEPESAGNEQRGSGSGCTGIRGKNVEVGRVLLRELVVGDERLPAREAELTAVGVAREVKVGAEDVTGLEDVERVVTDNDAGHPGRSGRGGRKSTDERIAHDGVGPGETDELDPVGCDDTVAEKVADGLAQEVAREVGGVVVAEDGVEGGGALTGEFAEESADDGEGGLGVFPVLDEVATEEDQAVLSALKSGQEGVPDGLPAGAGVDVREVEEGEAVQIGEEVGDREAYAKQAEARVAPELQSGGWVVAGDGREDGSVGRQGEGL
jgi:hypothetical protein